MEDPKNNPRRQPKKAAKKKVAKKTPKKKISKSKPKDSIFDQDTAHPTLSSIAAILKACDSPTESRRRKSINAMGHNLQEHLGCFILIGYTVDGEPVNMTYAPTAKDMDSLGTSLQRYIVNIGGF